MIQFVKFLKISMTNNIILFNNDIRYFEINNFLYITNKIGNVLYIPSGNCMYYILCYDIFYETMLYKLSMSNCYYLRIIYLRF